MSPLENLLAFRRSSSAGCRIGRDSPPAHAAGRSASGVRIDCRRQQLPHTSSERPASAALLKTLSYVIFHDASSFAKTIMEDDIHPKQLRAARGLLNWSRGDLAAAAKTTERTIARLEDGASKPRASTADAIGKAFDKAGVMFIPENGGGRGVRLKKRGKRCDRQGGQRITQGQRADSIQKHCT